MSYHKLARGKTEHRNQKGATVMKLIERWKYLRDNDMETLYELNVHL